ncbi:hypothetical protein [Pelagibacterium luteolum]|uniref:Uncharacterized protein n=1 Tax=Pelagibacterium luteolum TaxID=440168 RepID=A0A1G7ZM63_9HYPH|nr:hypothetical protein [Pelagibacterium luteolum]SDH09677.1 hypothetical protein SAMN04487974_1215 [Pelagibacterium luteolum]
MTKTLSNTRRARIEALAAIAFGRAPDGGPEKGWQRKLARAIGAASSTITATLDLDHDSPPMDRKLGLLCNDLRLQMQRNIEELDAIQHAFAGNLNGAVRPYLVNIQSSTQDTWRAAFAESAGDLAAAFILDEVGDIAGAQAEIVYDGDRATAKASGVTVNVRHMPKIFEPFEGRMLGEARDLLATRGKERQPQIVA